MLASINGVAFMIDAKTIRGDTTRIDVSIAETKLRNILVRRLHEGAATSSQEKIE